MLLKHLPSEVTIARKVKNIANSRKKIQAFFKELINLNSPLARHTKIESFYTLSNRIINRDLDDWKEKVSWFLLHIRVDDFKRLINKTNNPRWKRKINKIDLSSPLWIVPMWEMPGKLGGFQVLSGNKYTFLEASDSGMENPGCLSNIYSLDYPFPGNKDCIFVIADIALATKIQMLQIKDAADPLPVVGVNLDAWPSQYLNQVACGRNKCLWVPKLSSNAILHAKVYDSLLTIYDINTTAWEALKNYKPIVWFNRLLDRASEWKKELASYLDKMGAVEIYDLLHSACLDFSEITSLAELCEKPKGQILENIAKKRCIYKYAVLDNVTVIDTGTSLINELTGERIADFSINITRVISQERWNRVAYEAVLKTTNTEKTILIDSERLTFKTLKTILAGEGETNISFNKKFDDQAETIALRLSNPIHQAGYDKIGWNQNQKQFLFPEYLLSDQGVLIKHELVLPVEPNLNKVAATTIDFNSPRLVMPEKIFIRQLCDEAAAVWVTCFIIVYNLLAEKLGYNTKSWAVTGDDEVIETLFDMAGCPKLVIKDASTLINPRVFENSTGWPVYFDYMGCNNRLIKNWAAAYGNNIIATVNAELDRLVLRANQKWFTANIRNINKKKLKESGTVVSRLLSCMLPELLKIKPLSIIFKPSILIEIFSNWAKRTGSKKQVIKTLLKENIRVSGNAKSVGALFAHLVYNLGWKIKRDPQKASNLYPSVFTNRGFIWFPWHGLTEKMTELGTIIPDFNLMLDSLQRAELTIKEIEELNLPTGLGINLNWWNRFVISWKKAN